MDEPKRKQHNSFLKTEEYKELKKSEKAKEREEFKNQINGGSQKECCGSSWDLFFS